MVSAKRSLPHSSGRKVERLAVAGVDLRKDHVEMRVAGVAADGAGALTDEGATDRTVSITLLGQRRDRRSRGPPGARLAPATRDGRRSGIGEGGLDGEDVLARASVADGARPRGVVAQAPADARLAARRRVGREEQPLAARASSSLSSSTVHPGSTST